MPWQACVGLPCSASSGGQLPLAELSRPWLVSLLVWLILRSAASSGAPPATLYGLVVMRFSRRSRHAAWPMKPSGANRLVLVAFLASNPGVGGSYGLLCARLGTDLGPAGSLDCFAFAAGVLALAQIEAVAPSGAVTGLRWATIGTKICRPIRVFFGD